MVICPIYLRINATTRQTWINISRCQRMYATVWDECMMPILLRTNIAKLFKLSPYSVLNANIYTRNPYRFVSYKQNELFCLWICYRTIWYFQYHSRSCVSNSLLVHRLSVIETNVSIRIAFAVCLHAPIIDSPVFCMCLNCHNTRKHFEWILSQTNCALREIIRRVEVCVNRPNSRFIFIWQCD